MGINPNPSASFSEVGPTVSPTGNRPRRPIDPTQRQIPDPCGIYVGILPILPNIENRLGHWDGGASQRRGRLGPNIRPDIGSTLAHRDGR